MQRLRYSIMIIVAGITIYFAIIWPQQKYYYAHHIDIDGTYLIKPIAINHFELTDTDGQPFNKNSLKHHWTFIFFGFTHCNMVCPTALNVLDKTYRTLQLKLNQNELPKIVFVSIDSDEDNIASVRKYIKTFNPHFSGAVTTSANITATKKIFHIDTKIAASGKSTSIDHTPEILLINPRAEIQAYFSYPPKAEKIAMDYYAIIDKDK